MLEVLIIIKEICSIIAVLAVPFFAYWTHELKKNTNSIKDALVATTKREAEASGNLQGRKELTEELKN